MRAVCTGVSNNCSLDNGGCEHLCLIGTNQTAVCACSMGYSLASNQKNCTGNILIKGQSHALSWHYYVIVL